MSLSHPLLLCYLARIVVVASFNIPRLHLSSSYCSMIVVGLFVLVLVPDLVHTQPLSSSSCTTNSSDTVNGTDPINVQDVTLLNDTVYNITGCASSTLTLSISASYLRNVTVFVVGGSVLPHMVVETGINITYIINMTWHVEGVVMEVYDSASTAVISLPSTTSINGVQVTIQDCRLLLSTSNIDAMFAFSAPDIQHIRMTILNTTITTFHALFKVEATGLLEDIHVLVADHTQLLVQSTESLGWHSQSWIFRIAMNDGGVNPQLATSSINTTTRDISVAFVNCTMDITVIVRGEETEMDMNVAGFDLHRIQTAVSELRLVAQHTSVKFVVRKNVTQLAATCSSTVAVFRISLLDPKVAPSYIYTQRLERLTIDITNITANLSASELASTLVLNGNGVNGRRELRHAQIDVHGVTLVSRLDGLMFSNHYSRGASVIDINEFIDMSNASTAMSSCSLTSSMELINRGIGSEQLMVWWNQFAAMYKASAATLQNNNISLFNCSVDSSVAPVPSSQLPAWYFVIGAYMILLLNISTYNTTLIATNVTLTVSMNIALNAAQIPSAQLVEVTAVLLQIVGTTNTGTAMTVQHGRLLVNTFHVSTACSSVKTVAAFSSSSLAVLQLISFLLNPTFPFFASFPSFVSLGWNSTTFYVKDVNYCSGCITTAGGSQQQQQTDNT